MNTKSLAVCFILMMTALSGCASPVSPTAEESPIPLSTDSVVGTDEAGFYSLSTRTGIAEVDAVLAAVESGDPQQLRALFRFTTVACTKADGLGGPPKCQENEAEGTFVDVFPFLGPEGHFIREAELSNFPGVNVISVYAVYQVSNSAYSEDAYPAGEYAVVFNGHENQPNVIVQIRNGIVRMDYIFPTTSLDEIIQRDSIKLILAPVQ